MSDFVRIMRGWTAMCEDVDSCDVCPIRDKSVCHCHVQQRTTARIVGVEQDVENWLKYHPLPSTPTWIKWLSENGIVDSTEDGNVKLLPLAYYPMDEEIAKKLGELENG